MGRDSNEVALSTAGLRLVIRERNRAPADDFGPGDIRLQCEVNVDVPNFSASLDWLVLQSELRAFAGDLETLDQQVGTERTVAFEPLEPEVKLKLHLNRSGQIMGEYRFRSGPDGPELYGRFAIDQTYLLPLATAFRRLAA